MAACTILRASSRKGISLNTQFSLTARNWYYLYLYHNRHQENLCVLNRHPCSESLLMNIPVFRSLSLPLLCTNQNLQIRLKFVLTLSEIYQHLTAALFTMLYSLRESILAS